MLKLVGLAVVVSVTLGSASAAQATNFTAAKYPVQFLGDEVSAHTIVLSGFREIRCEQADFVSSSLGAASESLTLTPIYGSCQALILGNFFDVTISGFGAGECDYVVKTSGSVSLSCAEGSDVTINVYSSIIHTEENTVCRYTIKGQSTSGATYTNEHPFVRMKNSFSLAYERTKGTLATCGSASANATYKGETEFGGISGGVGTTVDVG